MKRFLILILGGLALFLEIYAQSHRFRIMEYNVENLFDTLHAEQKADIEFTPSGDKQWTSRRYWGKLSKLSRVIAAAGEMQPVDLVALVEVENDSTMAHLTRRTKLWRLGYDYVISHSADIRGINVALLYQPHRFRLIGHDSLRVIPPNRKNHPSRDILHVCGELTTGDTLDLYICHLPSRKGGKTAERYRMQHTQTLFRHADSIIHKRYHPHLVITGDFNAFYPEKCITEGLNVQLPSTPIQPTRLYLLSHELHASAGICGTYKFQGEWNQLDQFIVNGRLLTARPRPQQLHTSPSHCLLVDFPFLLRPDRKPGGVHPHRSYLGTFYSGGYSDHLPLLLDLFY